ncbi:hypothetical protein QR680_018407 [Steinernema hermaphroditum]|uniref:Uncharacterized protein n=1 Tax=Steinernema hermaphroditum TaxID=289476 RepID=A0AA39HIT3_9BILA|nr:hypothetical protein QR680_018407 [Steinernema hermaphroditum]
MRIYDGERRLQRVDRFGIVHRRERFIDDDLSSLASDSEYAGSLAPESWSSTDEDAVGDESVRGDNTKDAEANDVRAAHIANSAISDLGSSASGPATPTDKEKQSPKDGGSSSSSEEDDKKANKRDEEKRHQKERKRRANKEKRGKEKNPRHVKAPQKKCYHDDQSTKRSKNTKGKQKDRHRLAVSPKDRKQKGTLRE